MGKVQSSTHRPGPVIGPRRPGEYSARDRVDEVGRLKPGQPGQEIRQTGGLVLRARGEGEERTCESWEMWRPKDKHRELVKMKLKKEAQDTGGRNGRSRKWLTQTIRRLQEEEWDEEFYRRGLDQQLRYLRVEVETHKARATARRKQVLALSTARLSYLQEQEGKRSSTTLDWTESSWQDRRERGRRTFSTCLRTWPIIYD